MPYSAGKYGALRSGSIVLWPPEPGRIAMLLPYAERRQKLRRVADYLCFLDAAALLYGYRGKAVVPGICIGPSCDCILTVSCDEPADWCPQCDADSVQSIFVLAGGH